MVLAGRERELAELKAAAGRAAARQGGLVLLGGEAGIGKTALTRALEESGELAACARGWCPGAVQTPPFGPWLDVVAQLRSARGWDPAPLPVPLGQADGIWPVHAMAEPLAAWLGQQAGGLLVILEDLQWSDSLTLELLRFLLPRLASQPVLVAATYRSDEVGPGAPLYGILSDLQRAGAQRILLDRLSPEAVQRMVCEVLPDAVGLAGRLHARTGGHPLFVSEMLALAVRQGGVLSADEPLPETVQQAIDRRLERLSPGARSALAAAAVIGERFTYDALAAAAGLPEAELLGALDEALTQRVIHPAGSAGDRFAFDHAQVAEVALSRLIGPRRRRIHLAVAEFLQASPTADPEAIAYHLGRAGDSRAGAAYLAAAGRALRLGALAQAALLAEGALAHTPEGDPLRPEAQLKLAFALRYSSEDRVRVQDLCLQALAGAQAQGDRAVITWCRHLLAWIAYGDQAPDSLSLLEAVQVDEEAMLGDARYRRLVVDLLGRQPQIAPVARTRASALALNGQLAEALHVIGQIKAVGGPQDLAVLHDLDANVAMYDGRAREAIDLYRRASDAAATIRKDYRMAFILKWSQLKAMLWAAADQPALIDSVAAETARLEQEALERSGYRWMPEGFSSLGFYQFARGDWEGARHNLLTYLERYPAVENRSWWRWWAARLYLALGQPEQAEVVMAPILPTHPGGRLSFERISANSHAMKARIAMARGNLAEAGAWLDAGERHVAAHGLAAIVPEVALRRAEWHRAGGNAGAAAASATAALNAATAQHNWWHVIESERLLGELATDRGCPPEARAHLERALDLAARCALPHEQRLAEQALARCQPASPLPDGLTEREAEVVRLVAAGLKDREIGEALFISVKTVQAHLRNIFNKAGVSNRAALVAYAARQGLVG